MVSSFSPLILNVIEKKMKDINDRLTKLKEKMDARRKKEVDKKRSNAPVQKNAKQLINKPKNIGTYENKIRGF